MSVTSIPQKVKFETWVRAGGRCEYLGCNDALWRDDLTLARMNRAYLAHIVADQPDGPRGDPVLSDLLKAEPSNIMLLCDTHHRMVDIENVEGHPVELLRRYKREHEERIERQTAMQSNRRTEVLRLGTRIRDRQGLVSVDQAREAVLAEERYPASENGIGIDLADLPVNEADPVFYDLVQQLIDRTVDPFLSSLRGPTGYPINHLSILALAPIPALIYLGRRVGDTIPAEVFQRQRRTGNWLWQSLEDPGFDYIVLPPEPSDGTAPRVAINLSLSGTVNPTEIERAIGGGVPTYTIKIAQPQRDFLRAKEQLELFQGKWRLVLAEIRSHYGEDCEVHLFPAIPNSVAVEIGRSHLPKVDPTLVVYDCDRARDGFQRALTI